MTDSGMAPISPDPSVKVFCSALRSFLIALGIALAAHGLGNSGFYEAVQIGAASVMTLGPAAWGMWNAYNEWRHRVRLVGAVVAYRSMSPMKVQVAVETPKA